MYCRGVRGATTVENDNREEILAATRQLLALMIRLNGIEAADVASADDAPGFSSTSGVPDPFAQATSATIAATAHVDRISFTSTSCQS